MSEPASRASTYETYFSWLLYGHSRVEWTHLFRPDGVPARQLVLSTGVPPFGRLATRMTLNDLTGRPTAIHGELILGPRPISAGASFGRNGKEVMVQWFRRYQPSLASTFREVTRVVVTGSAAEVQSFGEIKCYGRSLSLAEMGTAYSYQFQLPHYREALRLAETEGAAAAASFLKARYSYIEESWVREALIPRRRRYLGFAAESAAILAVGLGLEHMLPRGPVSHALQNGGAFMIGQLFRMPASQISFGRLGLAAAEAIPLTLLHYASGAALDQAEHWTGSRIPQRWVVQDFASLGAYAYLKSFIHPRFGAGALGVEPAAVRAARGPSFRALTGVAVLAWGAAELYSHFHPAPAVNWGEFDRRFSASEAGRLEVERDFTTPRRRPVAAADLERFAYFPPPASPRRRPVAGAAGFILARLLEGGEGRGPLSAALEEGNSRTLGEAVERLPPEARLRLERALGPAGLREILSLAQERDRRIFWTGVGALARRLRDDDRLDSAATLYYLLQLREDPAGRHRARGELSQVMAEGGKILEAGFLNGTTG